MSPSPDDARPATAEPAAGQPRRRRAARREQGPPVVHTEQAPASPAQAPAAPAARVPETVAAPKARHAAEDRPEVQPDKTGRPKRKPRHRARQTDSAAESAGPDSVPTPPEVVAPAAEQPQRRSRLRDRSHGERPHGDRDRRPVRETAAPEPARTPPPPARPEHAEAPSRPRDRRAEIAERALRNLVSTRSSQVTWPASIRARDYAAPTAADLAAAAEEVVIVQRHYTPAEPLQGKGRARPEAPLGRSQNKRGN